nr:hypothetical protein Iba_chr11bCG17090 [Ipomoea batatas]
MRFRYHRKWETPALEERVFQPVQETPVPENSPENVTAAKRFLSALADGRVGKFRSKFTRHHLT